MLYDPKWDQKTGVASLAGLIAWLETKDPTATYEWCSLCEPCLIEQYCDSIGVSRGQLHKFEKDGTNLYWHLSTKHGALALTKPHTFGAALDRARRALAEGEASEVVTDR